MSYPDVRSSAPVPDGAPRASTMGARAVAALADPARCEACWWWEQKMGKALPFQKPFPAVFTDIDRHARLHARAHVAAHAGLPPGFPDGFGPVKRFADEAALSWRVFQREDAASGLTVRGVPDEVVGFEGGRFAIFDYKTARRSERHDTLFPRYAAQLNLYAWIAQGLWGRGPSALGLVYFSPVTAPTDALAAALPFSVTTVPVPLWDAARTEALLGQAARLLALPEPPPHGRGCLDASKLDVFADAYARLVGRA